MKHVYKDGTVDYYNENGKLHRTDGPARVSPEGSRYWYTNGKRHRTNGPAVILSDGKVYWWIESKQLSFHEWIKHTTLSDKELTLLQLKLESIT